MNETIISIWILAVVTWFVAVIPFAWEARKLRRLLSDCASLQDVNREREKRGLPIIYDVRIDEYRA